MDYKASPVTGSKYTRSHRITIQNPRNLIPSIMFEEEEVVTLGPDDVLTRPAAGVGESMTADVAGTQFPLINPMDGSTIGTADYTQFQVMLYSLYLFLANRRDNG